MQMIYKKVETLTGHNPDGTTVVLSVGDNVKVTYDDTVDTDPDLQLCVKNGNTIHAKIIRLTKTQVVLLDLRNPGYMLTLKTKQIVNVDDKF